MSKASSILYVEDDENDIFLMQRAFRRAGITTDLKLAVDGQMAVDYLSGAGDFSNRELHPFPSLLLLDLNLPRLNGLEVLKWARTTPTVSSLPIVILTSSNQESDIQKAARLGANSFLVKPGKPEELCVMVKSICDSWLAPKGSLSSAVPPQSKHSAESL